MHGEDALMVDRVRPGPMYKAMTKTPARQSAMPVILAMPDELLSFTTSILHVHDIYYFLLYIYETDGAERFDYLLASMVIAYLNSRARQKATTG